MRKHITEHFNEREEWGGGTVSNVLAGKERGLAFRPLSVEV